MNYDQHQFEAVRVICKGCGKAYDMTQVHGPREKCLDCEPWVFKNNERRTDVNNLPIDGP